MSKGTIAMTKHVHLRIEFDLRCSATEFRAHADHVASAIAGVSGLVWKVWIIDEERKRAGGVYLFADRNAATAYLEGPIVAGLKSNPGIAGVAVHLFDVLEGPSRVTRGLGSSGPAQR
jgi:hypothetical protein